MTLAEVGRTPDARRRSPLHTPADTPATRRRHGDHRRQRHHHLLRAHRTRSGDGVRPRHVRPRRGVGRAGRAVLGPLHLRALRPAGPRPQQPRLGRHLHRSGTPTTPPPSSRRSDLAPCLVVGFEQRCGHRVDVALRVCVTCSVARCPQRAAALQPRPRRGPGVRCASCTPRSSMRPWPRATCLPAVDAFLSIVCPETVVDRSTRTARTACGTTPRSASPTCGPRPLEVTPADLAAVTIPALVVAGTTSHPAFGRSPGGSRAACPTPASSRSTAVTCPTLEHPDAFADVVSVFAAELDRRAASSSSPRCTP